MKIMKRMLLDLKKRESGTTYKSNKGRERRREERCKTKDKTAQEDKNEKREKALAL